MPGIRPFGVFVSLVPKEMVGVREEPSGGQLAAISFM